MDHFRYREGRLCCEAVPLDHIAERFGTPCYVYSRATIERHWQAFSRPLVAHEHLLCYSVKANSNLGILSLLAHLGSGFDIVSVGELERVLAAGGDPRKIVFSGVGKRTDELRRALAVGIHCFNVESLAELERLNRVAGEMGGRAPVSLRVNPDVDAGTHPYIATGLKESKFGIPMAEAEETYLRAAALPHLRLLGVDCHIGSQLTTLAPFTDALERVLVLVDRLKEQGITLSHLDMGGGLGIPYRHEHPPSPDSYAAALLHALRNRPLTLIIEPGRAIVGNAGILLTRVEYLKHTADKNFAIVDAAMNDLVRPALYHAWQDIIPVAPREDLPTTLYDIVGPVCESGDFLGRERHLTLVAGDLLAVRSAGAYGFSMSSNYNSRPRAAEVLVDDTEIHWVRARESLADLYAGERVFPFH
ncbi:Diaminopimelate decarboxylase [Gammaproteobacteria bacterium]